MSKPSSKDSRTVFWWVSWIVLTIGSFFLVAAFWTPWIAKHIGPIRESRAAIFWVTAVFGSWIVLLIPLIVLMYYKVDKVYDDARLRREKAALRFRTVNIALTKRLLSQNLAKKIQRLPEAIKDGHLVTVILKSGRKIPWVYIQNHNEILGVYNYTELPFETADVLDIENADFSNSPTFLAAKWLRLDGVAMPE